MHENGHSAPLELALGFRMPEDTEIEGLTSAEWESLIAFRALCQLEHLWEFRNRLWPSVRNYFFDLLAAGAASNESTTHLFS
jgi:hypothetical protein